MLASELKSLILKSFLFFFLIISSGHLLSQTVSGIVKTSDGETLPSVTIYEKGTTNVTTSNAEGKYSLKLSKGEHTIVFQFIGFQKQEITLNLSGDIQRNIDMQKQEYALNEVRVGKEDPAIGIMRKAIAKRDFYLNQVSSYNCQVYIKGLQKIVEAPKKIFGQKLDFGGALDSMRSGVVYFSESVSKLYVQRPNKIREEVISSKVSGQKNGFTFNTATAFYLNFYQPNLELQVVSERVFISPLSSSAFLYYSFKLLGTHMEDGRLINEIKVIPKRKNDPVFAGVINIVEDSWNIQSLQLTVTKDNQVNFIDTLKITQVFVPVKDDVWMPVNQRFDAKLRLLGIRAVGYFAGVFSKYVVNVPYKKNFFKNEVMKIVPEANKRDSAYWEELRPIPLTELEVIDYVKKDSLEVIQERPAFKDSIDKRNNGFNGLTLLSGYTYNRTKSHFSLSTNGIQDLVNYNTVEGVNLQLRLRFNKMIKDERYLSWEVAGRYGFANTHLNLKGKIGYQISNFREEFISVEGGRYCKQFDGSDPVYEFGNTWYTVFFERNLLKLYRQWYARLHYQRELFNGFLVSTDLTYSDRDAMYDRAFKPVIDRKKIAFTKNAPVLAEDPAYEMIANKAFIVQFDIRFAPGQKYFTRPDQKITLASKYPVFKIRYKRGIAAAGFSSADFDYLQGNISDKRKLGLLGTFYYDVTAGGFITKKHVELPDMAHFNGNRMIFAKDYLDGFHLLDYYTYSTRQWFVQVHAEHHFNGFLFNKIPGFRKLKLQEVLGAHFLYTPALKDYYEVNAGIENIFKLLRVDFVAGFNRFTGVQYGARVGLQLGFLN